MAKKSTTFKGQAKPYGKSGHFHESRRHSLQARGIKTGNLSGWKKTHQARGIIRYENKMKDAKVEIFGEPIYNKKLTWFVALEDPYSIKDAEIGTKKEAIRFAKETMEKYDTDGDGVPDSEDCDPLDPTKQDKKYPDFQWDEYEMVEGEVKYRQENWEDFGYDEEPTEDEVRDDVYKDTDIFDVWWDDLLVNLTSDMEDVNPRGYWKARVKNFGWRSQDGETEIFLAEDGGALLQKILPKTENTFRIYKTRTGYKIQNFHHDSPTGREWYYVDRVTKKELEKEGII